MARFSERVVPMVSIPRLRSRRPGAPRAGPRTPIPRGCVFGGISLARSVALLPSVAWIDTSQAHLRALFPAQLPPTPPLRATPLGSVPWQQSSTHRTRMPLRCAQQPAQWLLQWCQNRVLLPKFRPHAPKEFYPRWFKIYDRSYPRQGNGSRTVGDSRNRALFGLPRCDFHDD